MIEAPREIKLLQKERKLYVTFGDETLVLPCHVLRLHSPAADGQVVGKVDEQVNIISMEPVGLYAVKLIFDDGHQTGIYSWDKLYELGQKETSHGGELDATSASL